MMMDLAKNDLLWIEYDEYIHDNKLTKYERQLLRKRIRDGHSVYETVESRYLPGPADYSAVWEPPRPLERATQSAWRSRSDLVYIPM